MLYNDKKQKLLDSFIDYTENEYILERMDYVLVRECWNWWKFKKRIDAFDADDIWDDYLEENVNYDYIENIDDIKKYISPNNPFKKDIILHYKNKLVNDKNKNLKESKKRINGDFDNDIDINDFLI